MITIVNQIENYENNSIDNLPDYHIPRITHNTRTDFSQLQLIALGTFILI